MIASSLFHRPRAAAVLATLATALLAAGLLSAAPDARADDPPAPSAAAPPAGRFIPVPLTRVLDTRATGGSFASGETRVVDTDRAIPGTATAVVFNLTVVAPTGNGFLAAFPAGMPRPSISNLNFVAYQNRANMMTVAVGTGALQNDISVYVGGAGRAHVVVDVLGYYGAGGAGTAAGNDYQPLNTPVRLFDTRASIGALTNTYPKNTGIVTVDYGSPAVNRTISAVVMTLTVTSPSGPGWLTVSDGGPTASIISWVAGQSIGNLAIVPVHCSDSTCKTVEFYVKNNNSPSTQLVGDISGMYATPSATGMLFTALSPVRVVDTRYNMGFSSLQSGVPGVADVSRYAGSQTRAVAVNIQSIKPTMHTWLTAWSSGTKPAVTNLNSMPGRVDAIAAQVRVASNKFSTSAYYGPVNIVVDLAGTFALDPTPSSAAAGSSAKAGSAAAAPAVAGSISGS